MSVAAPPRPPTPVGPPPPPAGTSPPPEPGRRGLGWRLLLGCLVVLLAAAGTSATFVLGQVNTIKHDISYNPAITGIAPGQLAPAGWGQPETLLLVGDDWRPQTKYYHQAVPHLANEMLLVRLDPSKPWISMLSIPRELWVTIYPPHRAPYTNRFNSAYTAGGIPLLLSTIKQVLGLDVNHVIVVTFPRFERAIDQMGGVYTTIDRRYYHVNAPGGEQYQEIDLKPGYQDLFGYPAREYVSFRHNDTSLIRDARDQSFLLDVKKQYGGSLADNIGKFEKIFGEAVQTDPGLHSRTDILNLIGTLIQASGLRVRQVQFQTNLGPTFDTATPQQIAASVQSFLYGGQALPSTARATAIAKAVHRRKVVQRLPLVPTAPSEVALVRGLAALSPFPVEYPRVRDRAGSWQPIDPNCQTTCMRSYLIHAPGGAAYPIYVASIFAGALGQYYDVQGTTWVEAPLFTNPDQTIKVAGRTYYLYYDAQNLKMVAWFEHGAAYWIRNSLLNTLGNGELLAMAEQTQTLSAVASAPYTPTGRLSLDQAYVPARTVTAAKTPLTQTIGGIAGLLTLILVPLLSFGLIKRRRELRALRAKLQANLQLEAALSAVVPAVPVRVPIAAPAYGSSGSGSVGPGRARPARRRIRSRTWVMAGIGVAVIAVGAAGGAYELGRRGSVAARSEPVASTVSASTPVAVLNASGAPGAAADLAAQLRALHVHTGTVGNLGETRPPGLWILYGPGAREVALRLAQIPVLAARAPNLAPIDPAAQAAAGAGTQVIVVIA
jgi:LCP family protein required for cell wall assembly